jgi:hypothetical protein
MRRTLGFVVFTLAWMFSSPSARADVMVSTSLDLTEFQVVPTVGTFVTLSPFTASANAEAQDDLSGPSSQFTQVNDASTAASAATAFASASASASALTALTLAAKSASSVNIPGVMPFFASSTGQGGLGGDFGGTGLFEILDTSNPTPSPVDVTFNATLVGSQSLSTDGSGVFATSEIIFNLLLPDLSAVPISLDNPLSIGPSSSLVSPYSNTLMGTVTMLTNTEYTLIAEVDAESSGLNSVPEPSFLFHTEVGIFAILVARRAWRNKKLRKTA